MNMPVSYSRRILCFLFAVLLVGCADDGPVGPAHPPVPAAQFQVVNGDADIAFTTSPDAGFAIDALTGEAARALATLRRVTARYHRIEAALADGFVLLHPCEERPGHGTVGAVYVHMERLLDGIIDPASPDALIYAPATNGRQKLVGVEFAMPYALWPHQSPPEFLGHAFQPEDEFGVFALHAWVWSSNPEGMFAESNPLVSCEAG